MGTVSWWRRGWADHPRHPPYQANPFQAESWHHPDRFHLAAGQVRRSHQAAGRAGERTAPADWRNRRREGWQRHHRDSPEALPVDSCHRHRAQTPHQTPYLEFQPVASCRGRAVASSSQAAAASAASVAQRQSTATASACSACRPCWAAENSAVVPACRPCSAAASEASGAAPASGAVASAASGVVPASEAFASAASAGVPASAASPSAPPASPSARRDVPSAPPASPWPDVHRQRVHRGPAAQRFPLRERPGTRPRETPSRKHRQTSGAFETTFR